MLVFLGHLHVINLQQNNNKNKPMFVYFTILSSLYSILVLFIISYILYTFFSNTNNGKRTLEKQGSGL